MLYVYSNVHVGPVRADGKQALSVLDEETGTRKTIITNKNKGDEFMQKHEKSAKISNKFWGSAIGAMIAAPFAVIDLPKIARAGFGAAAAVLTGRAISFAVKANHAYREKQAVLKEIENAQQEQVLQQVLQSL